MFSLIWRVCTFQARLEEVPTSIPLLIGKITVNLVVLIFILMIASGSITTAIGRSFLFLAIISSYSFIVLRLYNLPEKSVQLLSGLLATMAMILIPLGVPYVILNFFMENIESNFWYTLGSLACFSLLLLASIWLYLVFTRLFKHALGVSLNKALTLTLFMFIIASSLFYILNLI